MRSERPVPEMFLLILVVPVIAFERARADFGMGQHVVGQHQRMAAHAMPEMKADARAFHLAAGEIHVGFAVLDRIFQLRIAFRQADFQGRITQTRIFAKQFVKDFDHGFIVENPLVAAAASRQPEPRTQRQIITVPVLAHPGPTGACDDAVERAHLVMGLNLHGCMGADKRVKIRSSRMARASTRYSKTSFRWSVPSKRNSARTSDPSAVDNRPRRSVCLKGAFIRPSEKS